MTQKISRYKTVIILLISIIIHLFLLLTIVIIQFDNSPHEAPVFLAQNEEPTEMEPPQRDWVSIADAVPSMPSPQAQEPPSAQAQEEPPIEQAKEEFTQESTKEPKEELSQEMMDKAVSLANELLAQSEPKDSPKTDTQEKKEPEPPKESVTQQIHKNLQKPPAALTLAQLTQGFLQHLQESPMAVQSNRQGQVSMEQLQHIHYCQKIIGCVVNSYKIHKTRTLQGSQMQQTRIQLALNKDGSVHTLNIVQSSGNMTIDQFLLNMFHDASSSFPPMPSSFKEQPYYLPLFNIDRLEAFQSANGWYIDNTTP